MGAVSIFGWRVTVMLDSGLLGFDGSGQIPERLAILLGQLRPNKLAAISKTISYAPLCGNYNPLRPWETIRYLGRGNWVNAYGLTNPGIAGLKRPLRQFCNRVLTPIVSVVPPDPKSAEQFARDIDAISLRLWAIEINISCPNHTTPSTDMVEESLTVMRSVLPPDGYAFILKVGYDVDLQLLEELSGLYDYLHGINSVPWNVVFPNRPSPLAKFGGGGVSGPVIYPFAVDFVKRLTDAGYDKPIIAGGGINSVEAAEKLYDLGASAVALGTAVHTNPSLARRVSQALAPRLRSA